MYFLAISTNIPMLLMTAFVLHAHIQAFLSLCRSEHIIFCSGPRGGPAYLCPLLQEEP